MRKAHGWIAVSLCFATAAAAARADTHMLTSTSRVYMDQERKTPGEAWIAPGRSWTKSGPRIQITREDLGVVWSIEPGGAYREYSLKEIEPAPAAAPVDMRKAWLDYYIPEFDWTFAEAGETKEINGFPCRGIKSEGEADFAEIKAAYWVCDAAGVPGGAGLRAFVLSQIKDDRQRAGLGKVLAGRPDAFPVLREETIENSIAPTIVQKWELVKLEEAPAPAGIYDLPAGLKKLGDDD